MLARREVSRLFDRETGPYSQLFNGSVDGRYLLRVVTLFRAFDAALQRFAEANQPPDSGIAMNALQVVAHLCFEEIGTKTLADPDADVSQAIAQAAALATSTLRRVIAAYPQGSYPTTLFKNTSRCEALVASVLGNTSDVVSDDELTLFDL